MKEQASRIARRFSKVIRHRCAGQGYIEFIIVLPIMLLLILLAWEFSYFWWSRMVVSSATFEAARHVANGQPPAVGYAVYNEMLDIGLGQMAQDHRGHFSLAIQPGLRSVSAQADVPYQTQTGVSALVGGMDGLSLKASAFFRLEQFFGGPPDMFE